MSNLTYRAETQPGQGITLHDLKMHKGFNGIVKRGDRVVRESGLFASQGAAERWATEEAKRYRDYRQDHGEGIEDRQDRERQAKKAERDRFDRMRRKTVQMYGLLHAFATDAELVREFLPDQALKRLEQLREIVIFVEG